MPNAIPVPATYGSAGRHSATLQLLHPALRPTAPACRGVGTTAPASAHCTTDATLRTQHTTRYTMPSTRQLRNLHPLNASLFTVAFGRGSNRQSRHICACLVSVFHQPATPRAPRRCPRHPGRVPTRPSKAPAAHLAALHPGQQPLSSKYHAAISARPSPAAPNCAPFVALQALLRASRVPVPNLSLPCKPHGHACPAATNTPLRAPAVSTVSPG